MDDILKELGWSDGFCIPVANDENKALELELQKKQKEKENLKSALEDIADRVSGMKKHLANVQHQFDQNQNLIFAHSNQKTAEENLVKLARIEDASLTSDIRKLKKEQGDVEERQNAIQIDIDRVLQQVENLNSVIKWDKDALLAWDEEVSRGEDDTFMLEKFRREDEAKFRELELKRQYLGAEVENKKNRLIGLKNDVLSMEQSLEKTAQMFRRQHVERMHLVQQWEGSVRILHQRDEDINRAIEEIGNLKALAKERLKDLEEQKNFFENEERNNKEVERDTENLNKSNSEIKEKIRFIETAVAEENDKLAELKNVLANLTTQLHKDINNNKSMIKEIEVKKENLKALTLKVEKAKEEREKSKNKTISAAERAKKLEEMIKEEEKLIEKNLVEIKKLDDLMFQVIQQLSELKEGDKCQIADIKRIEAYSHSIKKEITKAKAEFTRQKHILYNMDIAYMERDIIYNRMLGLVEVEDSEMYEKRILELEEIHGKLTATNNLLAKEVTRLEEDMRRITLDFQGDVKEESTLRNKRQEYIMVVECGQKQVKALRIQNQDKQVDENILKLRVKQAERAIDKVGGKVFTLEKQRLELEEAMKERELEIKALRDMLTVRRRVLNDQLANLNGRVNLAKVKVEHLKTKYEVAVLKLGKDENGEPISITYMKIKGAQEKFELQEMGDKLDSKIKKTEKEILAMENTLKVVNATNKAFRNNLQNVDSNSPECAKKEELEAIQAEVIEELRIRRSVLDKMDAVTVSLEEQLQEKLKIEETLLQLRQNNEQQKVEIEKELKEQEGKLERADKQLKRLIREIRGTHIQKFQTIEEKDIELRELMEQNEYGLQQLAELVAKTFDTGPIVVRYLSEKNLTLPMIKSPVGSIKCESMTSVMSQSRSSVSSGSTKSSESNVSRTSSCLITPSVVTLDSTRLSESSRSDSKTSASSAVRRKSSVPALRKESRHKSQSASSIKEQK